MKKSYCGFKLKWPQYMYTDSRYYKINSQHNISTYQIES